MAGIVLEIIIIFHIADNRVQINSGNKCCANFYNNCNNFYHFNKL